MPFVVLVKDVNFELYTNNDTLFLLYVIFFSHRGGHVYCYFVSYMFLLKQSCDYVLYGLSREFDFICTTQKKQLFCLCILSLTCVCYLCFYCCFIFYISIHPIVLKFAVSFFFLYLVCIVGV